MSRLRIGLLVALVALLAAVAFAIALTPRWTPEQLRVEAESRLREALDAEVQVGSVALALGVGIHLEAEDVRLWVGEDGTGLVVETVAIGIEPLALLFGELRPRRMVLEGATMRIVEDADGHWSPPFGFLDPDPARGERSTDEEILLALNGIERALRVLLDEPYLADRLRVRNAVVTLSMAGRAGSGPDGDPLELRLALEDGNLKHRRLRGDAELRLTGDLSGPGGSLGRIALETVRDRHEIVTAELSVEALELGALESWLRRLVPRGHISGSLGGNASLSWKKRGVARVEVDLSVARFGARAPEGDLALGELSAPEADLRVELAVGDERVDVDELRLAAGDLELWLEGRVARPLSPDADAELDLRAREVDIAGMKALLEWMPEGDRENIVGPIEGLVEGRIARFDLRGRGSMRAWNDFFVGARAPVAMGLRGEIEAAGVVIQVGEEDQLEDVVLRARWHEDRLEVIEANGRLDGDALPTLHLKIDGVSNWYASDPSLRRISSGALPLSGIPLLWRLASDDEDDPDDERLHAAVSLDIETLQYPLFIWPLEDVHAMVESSQRGLNVLLTRGTWGGVPIEGSADWIFEPRREVYVQLEAHQPRALAQLPPPRYAWARGRFVIHPIESNDWHHLSASGAFSADAGTIRMHDVAVDLQPTGTMRGSGSLNLAFEDHLPFQLSARLIGGDVADLSRQLEVAAGQATGSLSAWGTFEGSFREDASLFADLSGSLEIDARDGEIWRKLPPVLSIALASEAFNPFAERETIRYESVETHVDIGDGRSHTDSFSLDGPDLRAFAEGEIDLLRAPHELDIDVALFLFRQLDRAIEVIPVLNLLLLGTSENLVAAHFELSGPWDDPKAKLVPLRSFAAGGPASLVLDGVPSIVRKGFDAIGAIFKDDEEDLDSLSSEPKPFPWES